MSIQQIDNTENHTNENYPDTKWTEEDLKKYIVSGPKGLVEYQYLPETIKLTEKTSNVIYDMCEYAVNPNFGRANQHFYGVAYVNSVSDVISTNPLYNTLIYNPLNYGSHQIAESYPPPPEFLVPILDQKRYKEGKAQAFMFINPSGALLTLRTRETGVLYSHPDTNLNNVISIPTPPKFQANTPPTGRIAPSDAAKRSMKHFLSSCEFWSLGVFRAQYNSEKSPIIFKKTG